MRIRPSVVIALGLTVAAVGWILSGLNSGQPDPVQDAAASVPVTPPTKPPMQVRVIESHAEPFLAELMISGKTEASRKVVLRTETDGAVIEANGEEGQPLKQGFIIARLAMDDRAAKRAQATALVEQRQIEVTAARKLAGSGFQSQTKLKEAEANLAASRAALEAIRVDIARTEIKAPFDGVLADRKVELGDYAKAGDDIAEIVDLDPVLLVTQVSEREIGQLEPGLVARAKLIGGRELEGVMTLIAPSADPVTRTFRVEIEVANPDYSVRDGLTVEVHMPMRRMMAHRIPQSLLTLNDEGKIGVKSVDADGRATFLPVEIAGDTPDALWVTGLPDTAKLISVGQVYVSSGETVEVVPANKEFVSGGTQ